MYYIPVAVSKKKNDWSFLSVFRTQSKAIKACVRNFLFFDQENFKNYEKCFLFHLKSPFRSRDVHDFVFFFPYFPYFPDSKRQIKVE